MEIYLASPVRTAMGSFNGAFAEVPATILGAAVIRATLEKSGIADDAVDEVIMGNVLSAGLGQNPSRQAALKAGLPVHVGATTISKVCGSGLKTIMLAAQSIKSEDASLIVAGGMENMTRAPYLLEKARHGYRMGNAEIVDSLIRDGLSDAYDNTHMGAGGDLCAEHYGFTREEQDDFAVESHHRARTAMDAGFFADEIVPVQAPSGKEVVQVLEDEQPRRFNEEKLRKLRPAFGADGTVTAGNASSINDAAAAMIVLSQTRCEELNIAPAARILGFASAAREPQWFTRAPVDALQKLMAKVSLSLNEVDLFEINEAFAVVPMAAMKELQIPREKINVHGGAIALGHPIGASGARVLVTLLHAMQRRGAKIGVATLCVGGGEAVAVAVELVEGVLPPQAGSAYLS